MTIDIIAAVTLFALGASAMLRHARDYADRRHFTDWDRRGPLVRLAWSSVSVIVAGVLFARAVVGVAG